MRTFFLSLALSLACFASSADEPGRGDRKSILDAARPIAAGMAGQPVRIKVDSLQVDRGWGILVGELVSVKGGEPDWALSECHPDLDKMLWVVVHKTNDQWRVKHIDICAAEPPYWYMEQYGGLVWPCGVYAGLQIVEGE